MIKLMFSGWRLLMTFLVLVVAAALGSLGIWQLNRLNQRETLNAHINGQIVGAPVVLNAASINADALDYRRVVVSGVFDYSQEFLLRNRSFNEISGYHVITPMKLRNGTAVLVDRGWVPFTQSAPGDRKDSQVSGEVTIDGVARRSQNDTSGPQDPPFTAARPRLDAWFRINIPRIQQQVGYPLTPVFVEQQPVSDNQTTLPIPTHTSDLGPGPHLNYALQWFSFALILLIGYGAVTYQHATGAQTSE